jgi:hypothetical protein
MRLTVALVIGLSAFGLQGCVTNFQTAYDTPAPAEAVQTWRVVDVRVAVPERLVVSEAREIFPKADIVWREDPPGDRKAQVARIIADAARSASAGLRGSRPVVLNVTVSRFHALTFEAEGFLQSSGVHDIEFTLSARDARTGEVLAGPEFVEASLPALSGAEMAEARSKGASQKKFISAHLRRTFAGWLGLGPDARGSFTRLGG